MCADRWQTGTFLETRTHTHNYILYSYLIPIANNMKLKTDLCYVMQRLLDSLNSVEQTLGPKFPWALFTENTRKSSRTIYHLDTIVTLVHDSVAFNGPLYRDQLPEKFPLPITITEWKASCTKYVMS